MVGLFAQTAKFLRIYLSFLFDLLAHPIMDQFALDPAGSKSILHPHSIDLVPSISFHLHLCYR